MILDLTKEKVWRIKTFEEFKAEGKIWSNNVPLGWNTNNKMAYLYGLEISEQQASNLLSQKAFHINIDKWYIKASDIIYSYPVIDKNSIKKEKSKELNTDKERSIYLINPNKKSKQFTNFKIFK